MRQDSILFSTCWGLAFAAIAPLAVGTHAFSASGDPPDVIAESVNAIVGHPGTSVTSDPLLQPAAFAFLEPIELALTIWSIEYRDNEATESGVFTELLAIGLDTYDQSVPIQAGDSTLVVQSSLVGGRLYTEERDVHVLMIVTNASIENDGDQVQAVTAYRGIGYATDRASLFAATANVADRLDSSGIYEHGSCWSDCMAAVHNEVWGETLDCLQVAGIVGASGAAVCLIGCLPSAVGYLGCIVSCFSAIGVVAGGIGGLCMLAYVARMTGAVIGCRMVLVVA